MTTWADAHARAATAAAELHAELQIDLTRAVDVFDAINRCGLVLAFAPLGNVSGLYLPQGPSHPVAGVLLHSGHPRTRQRYTAGHELGHHVFGHGLEVDVDLEQGLRRADVGSWPDREKEAEAFGAWFLMPRRLMRRGLVELGIDVPRRPLDAYALSLWLGTSYTATVRQLSTVRLIAGRTALDWARVEPRALKRSLAGARAPDDLRNDVWWLDPRHHGHPIEARPGDRLVVRLPEIPSSGYMWRFDEQPEDVVVVADSTEDDWEPSVDGGTPSDATDIAGASHARSLLLEVRAEAQKRVHRLALVKDQPWQPGSTVGEFEVLLSINPSLSGVQLPESELTINR